MASMDAGFLCFLLFLFSSLKANYRMVSCFSLLFLLLQGFLADMSKVLDDDAEKFRSQHAIL